MPIPAPPPRARRRAPRSGPFPLVPLLAAALVLCAAPLGCCDGGGAGGGMAIGAEAPGFELPTVHGGDAIALADFEGRVVLVNFWASWCGPCQLEIPELETLFDRYEEAGLMVVGVSTDASNQDASAFLDQVPVSYPMVWDERGQAALDYKVMSLPRNVLIDRQGRVRSRHDGYDARTFESMKREIEDLLEESP